MDVYHSSIIVAVTHFSSTLFSDFRVKMRKCKDFTSGREGKERKNGKMEENNKVVFSMG